MSPCQAPFEPGETSLVVHNASPLAAGSGPERTGHEPAHATRGVRPARRPDDACPPKGGASPSPDALPPGPPYRRPQLVGRARLRRAGGTLQSSTRCSPDALSLGRSLPGTDSGRCISVPYGARAWHAPATSRTPFLAVELPPYSPKRRNSIRWRTSGTISAATSIRKAFAFPIGTTCTPSITRFTAMSKTPAHCQRAGNSWRPAPVHHFIAIGPPPLRGNARRNMRRVAAARRSSLSWQQCECWRRWPKICRTERHEN